MKHRNQTYFAILFIAISFVSAYAKANSFNGNIPLRESVSFLNQHQEANNSDIIKSIAVYRFEMPFNSNTVNYYGLQINFQHPEQDLLIKQCLVIRENLRRTSLRLLTYLKN